MLSPQIRLRDAFLATRPNICYGLGEWRQYEAGIWKPINELGIKKELQEIAVSHNGSKVSNALVSATTELLRAWTFVPDESFDQNPNILTFNDRTLEVTTGTARSHNPTDYVTSKLPFNYDPAVRAPVWEQFFSTTVPEHEAFLQEFAGYCLTPSTRYELAVWCWGPPGGGKSTFLNGLEAMLGARACVLGLNEIEQSSFALSQLIGKTLAVSTEQPSHFIKAPALLNAIISGETILVNRKFRDHVLLKPHAKILWAMNELPRIDSSGVGLFRRVLPIYFKQIAISQRDPHVREQIMDSGMGIVNWALSGLQRLNQRQRFAIPETLLEERETYRVQNDVPQLFINERCEHVIGARVRSSDLYNAYKSWCSCNGHKPLSSTLHHREMVRLGFKDHRYMDGKYWLDLELQEEPEFKVM